MLTEHSNTSAPLLFQFDFFLTSGRTVVLLLGLLLQGKQIQCSHIDSLLLERKVNLRRTAYKNETSYHGTYHTTVSQVVGPLDENPVLLLDWEYPLFCWLTIYS